MSHTPGPWYAEKSSEDFWYITMDEDAFGRAVGQTWNAGKGKDCQEANARVMAAGPQMLDVLPELLAISISHYGNPTDETCGIGLLHAKARAAIAKAEGCQ